MSRHCFRIKTSLNITTKLLLIFPLVLLKNFSVLSDMLTPNSVHYRSDFRSERNLQATIKTALSRSVNNRSLNASSMTNIEHASEILLYFPGEKQTSKISSAGVSETTLPAKLFKFA